MTKKNNMKYEDLTEELLEDFLYDLTHKRDDNMDTNEKFKEKVLKDIKEMEKPKRTRLYTLEVYYDDKPTDVIALHEKLDYWVEPTEAQMKEIHTTYLKKIKELEEDVQGDFSYSVYLTVLNENGGLLYKTVIWFVSGLNKDKKDAEVQVHIEELASIPKWD